jgi:plasmid stabilization system protein ParE
MGDSYRVVISGRAAADIVAVHDYIAADSPQNAAAVARRILQAIDQLGVFPHRYPIYQGRRRPSTAVRRMPEPPVLVYYKINEPDRVVEVITVRHGKRRQPRKFG